MNAFWAYFWPAFGAGAIIGLVVGTIAMRRPRIRNMLTAAGAAVALGAAALWHGPLGGADNFAATVEATIHKTLVFYEIPQFSGELHHDPLTRRVLLSGPADDFQRRELVRLIEDIPGVSSAGWSAGRAGVPLIVEGALTALLGFILGLLVAYLIDLRRRYNAQWNW